LNAVIGVTGLLLDTPLAGVQREYCDAIRISSDMLLTLINDILDFSKIEAGRMELESQPFELGDCIEEAVDLVATAAVNKGLRVSCDVAEGLPEVFVGDVMRLRQVLVNLLGNAVKFTDAGDVSIAVSGMPSGPNLYQLHFVVHDTGVGIPPEDQSQLFNSFTQVDSSTTRRFGGTGLGLAISKRIVELMGGTIWVESDGVPGEGASFHFTIRAERAAEDRLPDWGRAELEELAGKTVLIVDDNETNAHLIGVRAAQWKMIPTTVASAEEAIRTLGDGRCFDVAIVGLNMPNMDGLGVAKSIQAMPSAKDMPLVLISSSVVTARELEKAGYAAKVLKPVSKQRLCNALRTAIGSPRRSDAAGRPAVGGSRRGLRVLLVEDNPIGQKVAANMIEKLGHRTDVVSNGLEAVRATQDIPYDVVFMDCQMPEMDGYEATRRIRESEKSRRQAHIPIIAMTAHALEGDREKCLAAGMDDYLSKPVKLSQLQQLLDGLSRQSPPGLPLAAVPPADSFIMHEVVQP
jgi:CheY-like chemotaxis protein